LTNPRTYIPTTVRVLDFSKEDLQTAKFKSTDKSNPDSWITTFDALSAYISKPFIELDYAYEKSRI
jgi:hypothetical protein